MMREPALSVVVIGRNEGERLKRCLESVTTMEPLGGPIELLYVDSASTDGSPEVASDYGAKLIRINATRPCAAAGRNAGWKEASAQIVLFLDGDTVLARKFVADSLAHFDDPRVAVVFGRRSEIRPEASIFNRVLDLDWVYPVRQALFCGGDALIRRSVLEEVNGFDERLIAGEEPEMCWRIRAKGYKIVGVDRSMVAHDLAMTRCSQYWRRALRSGFALAEISNRFRHTSSPLWLRESRRNILQGIIMLALFLLAPTLAIICRTPIPIALAIGIVSLLSVRTARRARWKSGSLATLLLYGLHSHVQHIPILFGQLMYRHAHWMGRVQGLIEYKGAEAIAFPHK
jgi:cellulose synthase/poly-beta-1,6-N-acetylglucosamine synthase-like glycosyltransferase